MFLSLRQLELGKVHFDQRFSQDQLHLEGEPGIEIPAGIHAVGDAELASVHTGEIRLRGALEGTAVSPCDRCLERLEIPLSGPIRVSYEPRELESSKEEVELTENDVEVGYYEGNGLELADVVREQVLLALPMQKLCRPDCQGICPTCGANRNETACECKPPHVEERWAALKSLKQ